MELRDFNLWTFSSIQKGKPSKMPCTSGTPGNAHDSIRVQYTRFLVASFS